MQARVLYIFDALCGWCYAFSPVMQQLYANYGDRLPFEVMSGGMVPPEFARPVREKASFIAGAYRTVEEYSGIRFGQAYLEHIFNPDASPWVEESLTPATALCLLKSTQTKHPVALAAEIQKLHMVYGKDLSDSESYREMAEAAGCEWEDFKRKLASGEWQDEARYEFALVKQLGITGFPAVLLQTAETKFYFIAKGYTPLEDLEPRLEAVLKEVTP